MEGSCPHPYNCSSGLILPLLKAEEATWPPGLRCFLYLLGLLYSFLGVAIGADVFMCAIERITSQKRKVKISAAGAVSGEEGSDAVHFREVEVWNPTVANLTLMALGSSAPEILLSIIEIMGSGFVAGALGPATIVGSAAFNLLAISAICIISIPKDETRRIKEIWVFGVTSMMSLFAYIWLLVILKGPSPNEVEVWEGVLTLGFFPLLVLMAYVADKKFCLRWGKSSSSARRNGEIQKGMVDTAENMQLDYIDHDNELDAQMSRWREIEREVALQYPDLPVEDLAKVVAWRLKQEEPHDRLYYRIMASRWMGRSQKSQEYWDASSRRAKLNASASISHLPGAPAKKLIEFTTRVMAVVAGDRTVRVKCLRRGRNTKKLLFTYETVNGSAKKNIHFLPRAETLVFEPGETEKFITIELVEGADWKPGDTFYVRLGTEDIKTELGQCTPCEIQYLDNMDKQTVEFIKNHKHVRESAGHVRIPVIRRGRLEGRSMVGWETTDGTAETGKDYEGGRGELEFLSGEVEKYIDIGIIDDLNEEYAETFRLELLQGSNAVIGSKRACTITITCDDGASKYFRQMDTLVPNVLAYLTPGGRSYKDQIVLATQVNAGDIENATWVDIFFHIFAFPWKMLFAAVPPPSMLGGWLTFVVALALIGLLTAVIGDLAAIFGCLIGLEDSVTAITFVALGTSLPDTFASRLAAVNEATADNSIGNVTGSNCVNVFLGLGLPWLIAAIYWKTTEGINFPVPAGSLAFSVTIYTVCASMAILLLILRRYVGFFGNAELGGKTLPKYLSAAFLVFLWFLYVLLSTLQAYGFIDSF